MSACCVSLLLVAGSAQARISPAVAGPGLTHRSTDSVVPVGGCFFTHQRTVPAGPITLRFGWVSDDTNLLHYFLRIEHTTFSVNGGAPIDVSADYGPLDQTSIAGGPPEWEAPLTYSTGLTLDSGQSMTISGAVSTWLPFFDLYDNDWTIDGPGVIYGGNCTVTAS